MYDKKLYASVVAGVEEQNKKHMARQKILDANGGVVEPMFFYDFDGYVIELEARRANEFIDKMIMPNETDEEKGIKF